MVNHSTFHASDQVKVYRKNRYLYFATVKSHLMCIGICHKHKQAWKGNKQGEIQF